MEKSSRLVTYEDKVQFIFNYFGYETQRRKLLEEVMEFLDEVMKFENGTGDIKKVEEEFRDVNVVLDGFRQEYEILVSEDMETKTEKADRTIDRIRRGYYDHNVSK